MVPLVLLDLIRLAAHQSRTEWAVIQLLAIWESVWRLLQCKDPFKQAARVQGKAGFPATHVSVASFVSFLFRFVLHRVPLLTDTQDP